VSVVDWVGGVLVRRVRGRLVRWVVRAVIVVVWEGWGGVGREVRWIVQCVRRVV